MFYNAVSTCADGWPGVRGGLDGVAHAGATPSVAFQNPDPRRTSSGMSNPKTAFSLSTAALPPGSPLLTAFPTGLPPNCPQPQWLSPNGLSPLAAKHQHTHPTTSCSLSPPICIFERPSRYVKIRDSRLCSGRWTSGRDAFPAKQGASGKSSSCAGELGVQMGMRMAAMGRRW